MLLDIVAGLLGSQLMRAVAFDVATSLLCQVIQYTVTSAASPSMSDRAARPSAHPTPMDRASAAPEPAAAPKMRPAQPARQPSLLALPRVEIVSSVSGRLRLRIPGVRGDAGRAAEVAALARALDGVTSAQANPRTGTLLVHFDPDETSVSEVVAALEAPAAARPRAATSVPYLRLVVG